MIVITLDFLQAFVRIHTIAPRGRRGLKEMDMKIAMRAQWIVLGVALIAGAMASERRVAAQEKYAPTPATYPRRPGIPHKRPLG